MSKKFLAKGVLVIFFSGLIVFQNITVFNLLQTSLSWGVIQNAQIVLSAVIVGTLFETFLIAREFGKWFPHDFDKK